jgi:hypothetical protein
MTTSRMLIPTGCRLSACGLRMQVRRTCLRPRCNTVHNRSLRRQISPSSPRRDRRPAQPVSVEAHHCIGCSAWRAVVEPACASDFLIAGHGANRCLAIRRWGRIEHESSIRVCSVLLTRKQEGEQTWRICRPQTESRHGRGLRSRQARRMIGRLTYSRR